METRYWHQGVTRAHITNGLKTMDYTRAFNNDLYNTIYIKSFIAQKTNTFLDLTIEFKGECSEIMREIVELDIGCNYKTNIILSLHCSTRAEYIKSTDDNLLGKLDKLFIYLSEMNPPTPDVSQICIHFLCESELTFPSLTDIPALLYHFNKGNYAESLMLLKILQSYKQNNYINNFCQILDEGLYTQGLLTGIELGNFNRAHLLEWYGTIDKNNDFYELANKRYREILQYLFSENSTRNERATLFLYAAKKSDQELKWNSYHLLCGLDQELHVGNIDASYETIAKIGVNIKLLNDENEKLKNENQRLQMEIKKLEGKSEKNTQTTSYSPKLYGSNTGTTPDNNPADANASTCNIQ